MSTHSAGADQPATQDEKDQLENVNNVAASQELGAFRSFITPERAGANSQSIRQMQLNSEGNLSEHSIDGDDEHRLRVESIIENEDIFCSVKPSTDPPDKDCGSGPSNDADDDVGRGRNENSSAPYEKSRSQLDKPVSHKSPLPQNVVHRRISEHDGGLTGSDQSNWQLNFGQDREHKSANAYGLSENSDYYQAIRPMGAASGQNFSDGAAKNRSANSPNSLNRLLNQPVTVHLTKERGGNESQDSSEKLYLDREMF